MPPCLYEPQAELLQRSRVPHSRGIQPLRLDCEFLHRFDSGVVPLPRKERTRGVRDILARHPEFH